MPPLVLKHHHERAGETPGQRPGATLKLLEGLEDESAHTITERQNLREQRPVLVLLRNFGVGVTVVGVVNVRVDATLEDHCVVLGLSVRLLEEVREEHVHEAILRLSVNHSEEEWDVLRRDVTNIEQTLVTKVDRLLVKHFGRDPGAD